MDFEIVWTARASADVEQILAYIAQDNPKAAHRAGERIMKRVGLLRTTPHMGRRFGDSEGEEIRWIVSGKYKIFYTVHSQQSRVEILTVWHGARRDPDLSNRS